MNEKDRLNADEVMCLQVAGMSTPEIMRMGLKEFDSLYDRNEEYDVYLEKANSILDRQEALGIVAVTCHDDRFPARLKAIGRDCPPVVF